MGNGQIKANYNCKPAEEIYIFLNEKTVFWTNKGY